MNTHISTISKTLLVEELMALVGRASADPPAYRAKLERMDVGALGRLRECATHRRVFAAQRRLSPNDRTEPSGVSEAKT